MLCTAMDGEQLHLPRTALWLFSADRTKLAEGIVYDAATDQYSQDQGSYSLAFAAAVIGHTESGDFAIVLDHRRTDRD